MFDYNLVLKKKIKIKNSLNNVSDNEIIEKYKKGEFRIVTEQARYPLANLKDIFSKDIDFELFSSGKQYDLNPEYQRRRVWDNKRKSRLIESFIINVPIPPIFLYEVEYSSYEIMDGLQRVSTIIDYLDNKFELSNLEVWPELEGKTYEQLPRDIRLSIDRRYLSSIILLKETAKSNEEADAMKKFVFQRLNTGGVELSAQEIRNALYMGKFNEKITSWAENSEFRELWGELDDESYKRMEDCELILRFFAYKSACKLNVSFSTVKILDMYAEEGVEFSEHAIMVLHDLLCNTLKIAKHLFGDDPFKSQSDNKKSEKMIFDAVMIACAEIYEENRELYTDILTWPPGILREEKFKCVKDFNNIFNGKYTAIKNVRERVRLIKELIVSKNYGVC